MTRLRRHMAGWVLVVVRVLLAFMLAFGTTLWAQTLWAGDAFAAGKSGGSASSSSAAPTLSIADIGVFEEGTTRNAFAYASEGAASDEVRAVIERKGGQIDFDAAVLWNDGSDWEYDSDKVQWRIDKASTAIARISPSGILEAAGAGDGIVTVTAFVDGGYTADGAELAATFKVELRGQTDAKFVTGLVICDEAGVPIEPSYRFEPGTLSTAMLELEARVTVFDPALEAEEEYLVTPSSGLAAQTGGELSDLIWDTADSRLGTVSDEGIYRPAVTGTNMVYAASTAGFNGTRISAQAVIDMPPADGEEASNGYHPQNTLTVKVYYENYPDQQVGEKVFSLDDLEGMNPIVQTYTAMRGKEGYLTTTGRGPLLSKVLEAAGVNTAGVARLRFGTPDNYQGVVSWDLLVDTSRYYFPNIDIGSYADRVQVAPMIAIDSYRNVGSDPSVHVDDMTDTRRFLLLFGAKATGETTTNLQVYNIHTLYVELQGSPPVKPGTTVNVRFVDALTGEVLKSVDTTDPESVGAPEAPVHDGYAFKGWAKTTDANGNITYTAQYEADGEQPGEKDDPGGKDDPDKPQGDQPDEPQGDQPGGGTHDLVDPTQGRDPASAASAAGGASAAASTPATPTPTTVTQLNAQDLTAVNPGRWSVLQSMNRHPSNVADLMLENPFAPFAAPTFAGILVAGGLEAGLAYYRQKRRPKGFASK